MLLKTLIIGGILFLATRKLAAFLLTLAVAQIDPLAVANLLTDVRPTYPSAPEPF